MTRLLNKYALVLEIGLDRFLNTPSYTEAAFHDDDLSGR